MKKFFTMMMSVVLLGTMVAGGTLATQALQTLTFHDDSATVLIEQHIQQKVDDTMVSIDGDALKWNETGYPAVYGDEPVIENNGGTGLLFLLLLMVAAAFFGVKNKEKLLDKEQRAELIKDIKEKAKVAADAAKAKIAEVKTKLAEEKAKKAAEKAAKEAEVTEVAAEETNAEDTTEETSEKDN